MFRVRNLVNTTGKTTRGVCEDLAKVEVSHSGRLRESSESVAPFFQLIHGAGKIYTGRRARPRGGNRHASVAMLGPWGQEGAKIRSQQVFILAPCATILCRLALSTHSLRNPRYDRVRGEACCTATESVACAGSESIVTLHSPATSLTRRVRVAPAASCSTTAALPLTRSSAARSLEPGHMPTATS